MEQIKDFISKHLRFAEKTPSAAQNYLHQAYGATMFYLEIHPEDFDAMCPYWEDISQKFQKIIYDYYN